MMKHNFKVGDIVWNGATAARVVRLYSDDALGVVYSDPIYEFEEQVEMSFYFISNIEHNNKSDILGANVDQIKQMFQPVSDAVRELGDAIYSMEQATNAFGRASVIIELDAATGKRKSYLNRYLRRTECADVKSPAM